MRTSRTPSLALALALSACGSDFDPRSLLTGTRVLSLAADPTEIGPFEQVTVRPTVYLPDGATVTSQGWRLCPLSVGASAAYACALPECEVALEAAADGSLTANPTALVLECATRLQERLGGQQPGAGEAALPERVELIVRYAVATSDGGAQEAVLRLPFWTKGAPAVRNRPPAFEAVSAGGLDLLVQGNDRKVEVAPGSAIAFQVRIDPESLDSFRDASGREVKEEPVVSFYATAGRFDVDRSVGLDGEVTWTAEPLGSATEATFFAVARDLRGGQAAAGPFRLPISR